MEKKMNEERQSCLSLRGFTLRIPVPKYFVGIHVSTTTTTMLILYENFTLHIHFQQLICFPVHTY